MQVTENANTKDAPSQFFFHGTGKQFFSIWIVNIALIILTLGIYTAWAKVRTSRFFYQNLELEGSRFEYHATPLSLLRGYLIVAIFVFVYSVLSMAAPVLSGVSTLAFVLTMPWAAAKALQFKLANSSYRGVHFSFNGSIARSYFVIFGPLLGLVALFSVVYLFTNRFLNANNLLFFTLIATSMTLIGVFMVSGYFLHAQRLYVTNNSKFGNAKFSCHFSLKTYSMIVLKVVLLFVLSVSVILLTFAMNLQEWYLKNAHTGASGFANLNTQAFAAAIFVYLSIVAVAVYGWTTVTNAVWNHTLLADAHLFHCEMSAVRTVWIVLSNLALNLLTLGLFIPFGKVRLLKYRVSCTKISIYESLENIYAEKPHRLVNATAEGAADYAGIGFAI